MDASLRRTDQASEVDAVPPPPEASDFVRYCYQRRPTAWPELYDEMCAVAARGSFRGWGYQELAERGIGFTLRELPGLAALAAEIAREERASARDASGSAGRFGLVPAPGRSGA